MTRETIAIPLVPTLPRGNRHLGSQSNDNAFPRKSVETSNEAMTNFHEIRFENALTFYNGKVVNVKNTGDIPVYGSNGIIGFTDKSLFEDGIIIGRVGAYCGATIYERGKFWGSDNTIIVEAKTGFDNQYLSYLLQVIDLNWFAGGSAQPLITHGWIKPIKAKMPDYFHQQKIAAILSAYDDLIENNLQRIKLLEEMAQITYEEWFVRMKFPGHEHTPIDPETGLPEGWFQGTVRDVSKVNGSSISAKSAPDKIRYIDIASVHTGGYEKPETMGFSSAPSRARRQVFFGDTIFSTVRPNRKTYSLILENDPRLIVSTGFAVLTPKTQKHFAFVYLSVANQPFVDKAVAVAGGAAYPAVNQKDFEKLKVIVPTKEIIDTFSTIVNNYFKVVGYLGKQNNLLKEARDILLPRLMTGMIDVDAIELPEALLARMDAED